MLLEILEVVAASLPNGSHQFLIRTWLDRRSGNDEQMAFKS
jgi:hypothetical protein